MNSVPLPPDVMADLNDAFNFYDKEGAGIITIAHFRNILRNFGFHKLSKQKQDEELRKATGDIDFLRRTAVDYDTVKFVVGYRWVRMMGSMEEAKECFQLFDKRGKEKIDAGDLKQVLSNYLEFPVSENDIRDFIAECGGGDDGNGSVQLREFSKLYLS